MVANLRRFLGLLRGVGWILLLALADTPWRELAGWLTEPICWRARVATALAIAGGMLCGSRRPTPLPIHAAVIVLPIYLGAQALGEVVVWGVTSVFVGALAGHDLVYGTWPLLFGRPAGTAGPLREPDVADRVASTFVVAPEIAIEESASSVDQRNPE